MKKFLLCGIFLWMMFVGQSANALIDKLFPPNPLTNPWILGDTISSIITTIDGLLFKADQPQLGGELNVIQQAVGALMDGDESYRKDEGTGESPENGSTGGLEISAFGYLDKNVFSGTSKSPFKELDQKLTKGADMKQVVKDLFFIENKDEDTEAKRAEVVDRRTRYLTTIAKYYVTEAYDIQQALISDADAVLADINGNGSIGATAGLDQTWKAVNKALIADIALQIQLMELDAAKFLSVQPIAIMSEERPAVSDVGGNGAEGGNT